MSYLDSERMAANEVISIRSWWSTKRTISRKFHGQHLCSNAERAVTYGIPTWENAIRYAERDPPMLSKMTTEHPHYFSQPPVQQLHGYFLVKYSSESETCRPFLSKEVAMDASNLY